MDSYEINCMKRKAVFLDRDGTINVDRDYLFRYEEFEYLSGAKEGMKLLQDSGYMLIIITNQSGIARGYYTEEDYRLLTNKMIGDLEKDNIHIVKDYYCPHHPDAVVSRYKGLCGCRKPKTGLFWKAAEEWHIDMGQSYAMGDKPRDVQICRESRVKGFLLYSDSADIETTEHSCIKKIRGGILEAAVEILGLEKSFNRKRITVMAHT